jgi:antitoxin YefM
MAITASEARRNLLSLIQQVNDDRTVVEIVSQRGNAVLMSAEEYAALQETAYLLRSPANARRLLDAYSDALEGCNRIEIDRERFDALLDQIGDALAKTDVRAEAWRHTDPDGPHLGGRCSLTSTSSSRCDGPVCRVLVRPG